MKKLVFSVMALGALLTSCSNDDDNNGDGGDPQVTAPATYSFERNGETSVSYSGQTTRILMGEELISAMKDPARTEAEIDGMFAHEEGNNDFSDADLNASNKSVRGKTAASFDFFSANTTDANAIKADFDAWIAEQVNDVYPNWSVDATAGNAGRIQEAGGGSLRYVNGKGLELNQAVNKSLIGALMVDQMLNNYISSNVLNQFETANDSETLVDGKNYTDMEHDWDEAFGYLYGTDNATNPQLNQDSFLNKYLSRVEGDADFAGIAQTIYDALKLGRAAIVAKDYDLRNEQADIIREEVSKVIGIRAVYYLQQGKNALEADDYGAAFHDLSEGFGFIYSLQFTRVPGTNNPYFTKAEVDAMITQLMAGNGFWDVTSETLDSMSEDIATSFGFTVAQAGS
ncbi:DUF4856 domain-containing protein [Winogradskyella sp. 3972H.M.0a.05]|uniref:DUF4856 domain-containing protein n=1 Tax=Winogradskyella sp. 3972H.M.0a.05 TaxID=2950277 RepID=UPI003395DC3A